MAYVLLQITAATIAALLKESACYHKKTVDRAQERKEEKNRH